MIQAFPRHRGIKRSTKAIIFLGCPHFGSNLAKWGVVAARVLYPLGSNPLVLQGLEYGSLLLHDLHRRFVDSSSDTKVINFFEQRKVRILKLGWFQWEMLCVIEQSATWPGHTVENLGLPVDHYSLNKFGSRSSAYMSIRDKINSLIQSMHPSRQNGYKSDKHRNCHRIFKSSTYEQFKNINPNRVQQTCQWALSHPLYLRWRGSATDDLLWISADPGCGKSVLSKALVDEELPSGANDSTVCYFFFKDNDEQNSLATCLCALLHQLFQHQPHLLQHAVPACDKDGDKLQREIDELWRILLAATSDAAARNTICVLDALDECKDTGRSNLIAKLSRFHKNAASQTSQRPWLKFVVTSRPYDEIQRDFHHISSSLPAIRLHGEEENDQIRAEINRVIEVRISKLEAELHLKKDLRDRLTQKLLSMEHRTYLWLHLAMDGIRTNLKSSRPNEEAIESVPLSVQAAYEGILDRIPQEWEVDAKIILQITIGARRPLTVAEMALAFGAAINTPGRRSRDVESDPVRLRANLRDWCGLFVFINDSKIFLIHQTAREFLVRQSSDDMEHSTDTTWRHCIRQAQMEQMMTAICVTCLNLEDRKILCDDDISASIERGNNGNQNFIEYCCEWWTTHYRLSQDASGEDTFQDVLALYNTEGEVFKFWFNRFWTTYRKYSTKGVTPLHLAALSNHGRVVEHFLEKAKIDVEAEDEIGRTAMTYASWEGHDKIVQMLFDKCAKDFRRGQYIMAFSAAAEEGYEKIVQLLLDRCADDALIEGYGEALSTASGRGHDEVVHILLDKCLDSAQSDWYGWALESASEEGQTRIVQLLLDKCPDSAQSDCYGDALCKASEGGHEKIVQLLLDKCPESAQSDWYALAGALRGGHDTIAQLLLDKHPVSTQSDWYFFAIGAAAVRGRCRIVQMLLDRGDVNAQGGEYNSAFRAAAASGHDKIVQMLLDRGADVNFRNEPDGNALQAASLGGFDKVVQLLLERGADVNAQGGQYGNALQAASLGGFDKVVQLLLERGADVNAQGGQYGNALQTALARGFDTIGQELLNRGADVNTQGGLYGNALQAALAGGCDKIVQELMNRGVDVNARGGLYGNALQAASCKGYDDIVQELINRDADVNAQGGKYGNALHAASERGFDKIVQLLLDKGATAYDGDPWESDF